MTIRLYELNQQYNQLLEMAGDLDPQVLKDTLESIKESIEDKAENTAKLIRSWEAEAKAIKEEEKRLAERRKSLEKRVDNTKAYLFEQMELAGMEKVKRPTLTISIANNPPSVQVIDPEKIPSFFMIEQEPKIDKKAILEALKNGTEIDGCTIKREKGLRIR
ncbi:MAG: siphovirus Gp157 family protein [Bacillus sp. (in: firmicutes)]